MKNLSKYLSLSILCGISLTLTACGSTSNSIQSMNPQAQTSNENEQLVLSDSAYPITLTHALGEITLTQKPEKIVAIAWGNPDVPLALGVIPVGISEANFGPRDDNNLLPWTAQAFSEYGVTPNVFSDTDGWDYEAISDCDPDVILASYSGLSQDEYARLSEIAPVMAYPELAWATTWREEAINDSIAMGMEEEGRELVAKIDNLVQDKLSEYPEIVGKRAAFCWLNASDLGSFYIYSDLDPRANFLGDLGLSIPESVQSLFSDNTSFYVTVSAENADIFTDIDIIITYGDDNLVKAMQEDARFANIPAVQNGSFVLLDSNDNLAAASTPTVLSIPYCIDDYLLALHEAVSKIQ